VTGSTYFLRNITQLGKIGHFEINRNLIAECYSNQVSSGGCIRRDISSALIPTADLIILHATLFALKPRSACSDRQPTLGGNGMKKKVSRRGCLIPIGLFVLLAVLAAGWWLYSQTRQGVTAMIPQSPVLVDLLNPANGTQVTSGEPVTVDAQALGIDPLASLELWVDGQPYGQQALSDGSPGPTKATWTWPAATPGIHLLFVRAHDVKGRTGQSTQVIVTVAPGLTQLPAAKDETLASIGHQFGFPPDQMAAANPGLDPQQPLSQGQDVNLPTGGSGAGNGGGPPAPPVPPSEPTQSPKPAPGPLSFWLQAHVFNLISPQTQPSGPDLSVGVNNCKVQLYITPKSDNASGFIVYRWLVGEPGFTKAATLGPGKAGVPILFEDPTPAQSGVNALYYVGAFNAAGEGLSKLVAVASFMYDCKPSGNAIINMVHWQIQMKDSVDQAYCYQSNGDGTWKRMPADPFSFFPGQADGYQALLLTGESNKETLSLECWGWAGGVLKYLGKGQTSFETFQPPDQLTIDATGFQAAGIPQGSPQMKTLGGSPPPGGENLEVPAPYALREATSVYDCASHYGGNFWANQVCDKLINGPIQEYYTLVWDWQPVNTTCWPGNPCKQIVNKIDGFKIYEIDQGKYNLLKDIPNPDQKVTAIPIPWGARCYVVHAYANVPLVGVMNSLFSQIFCPGQQPTPQKMILKPTNLITTTDNFIVGKCSGTGGLGGENVNMSDASNEILVGLDEWVDPPNVSDCVDQHNYAGGIKFDLNAIPKSSGGKPLIVKATLRFTKGKSYNLYKENTASNEIPPLCATTLGFSRVDWTNWSPGDALLGKTPSLGSPLQMTPITTIVPYKNEIDVTGIVSDWVLHPALNKGFVMSSSWETLVQRNVIAANANHRECWNHLNNLELEIQFFTPPLP
jgi:LysM repeat protein